MVIKRVAIDCNRSCIVYLWLREFIIIIIIY